MTGEPTRALAQGGDVAETGTLFAGRRALPVPAEWTPTLVVAIDTEEEFDWRAPPDSRRRSVTNIRHQPLLQAVFDRFGVVPTYLVDHPVATDPDAVAILRGFADAGRCEIGAHLHPWVTPPIEEAVDAWHAFACNLPPALERRKLETLTRAIEDAFASAPRIYRAGNYGIGPHTARFLAEFGYAIDTSIVPFTDFRPQGGPNFEHWSAEPFETAEGIVEIPLSAGFAGRFASNGHAIFPKLGKGLARTLRMPGIAARLALLERVRLSPEGHTLHEMRRLTVAGLARGERLFLMSLHSSSLLPGATEYVRSESDRTAFIERIDAYIRFFLHQTQGRTATVSAVAAALTAGHTREQRL